jgi:hypothetical protein
MMNGVCEGRAGARTVHILGAERIEAVHLCDAHWRSVEAGYVRWCARCGLRRSRSWCTCGTRYQYEVRPIGQMV